MKVITEAILRDELRASKPETYVIPEGQILSPAAREYLQQNKVKIVSSKDKPLRKSNIEVVAAPERKSGDHGYRGSGNPGKCSRHSGTAETQICG